MDTILFHYYNVRYTLQMATSTATTEALDKKIQSIKDVLSKEVSISDEQSLKRVLMEAMEEKKRMMESQLSSLKAKYGVQSQSQDVIIVDSPPGTKSIKQPPGKLTTEALAHLKKRKRTASEDYLDFEIMPPPSKKKLSLGHKKMVITVPDSEEDEEEEARHSHPKGKGKGPGKTKQKKASPTPTPTRSLDSDSPGPTPPKTKRRATPQKQTTVDRSRSNPWCNSSSRGVLLVDHTPWRR